MGTTRSAPQSGVLMGCYAANCITKHEEQSPVSSLCNSHKNCLIYALCFVVQGAATAVYAATAPQLDGQSGAYLQDCKVAKPTAKAQDAELAAKLWSVTEAQLAEARSTL